MLIGDNIDFYKYPHVTRDWRDKRDILLQIKNSSLIKLEFNIYY